MANNYRSLATLLAANFEALGMLLMAWWGGGWLEEHYPIFMNWYAITFLAALSMIVISWFRMFRDLTRKKDGESE